MLNMPQFIFQQLSGDFGKKVGRAEMHSKSPCPEPTKPCPGCLPVDGKAPAKFQGWGSPSSSTPMSRVTLQTCESRYKGTLFIPLQRADVCSGPLFWALFLEGWEVVSFPVPSPSPCGGCSQKVCPSFLSSMKNPTKQPWESVAPPLCLGWCPGSPGDKGGDSLQCCYIYFRGPAVGAKWPPDAVPSSGVKTTWGGPLVFRTSLPVPLPF